MQPVASMDRASAAAVTRMGLVDMTIEKATRVPGEVVRSPDRAVETPFSH